MRELSKNLLAGAILATVVFIVWGIEALRSARPGLLLRLALWAGFIGLLFVSLHLAHAHDHDNPDLDSWFTTLRSSKGPCCDRTDTMHLTEIDWVTQNKPGSHFRVKVPATKEGFEAAMKGVTVDDTVWIDVPDDAIVDEPNKAGTALVWPIYGYGGLTIRCFMPGQMS